MGQISDYIVSGAAGTLKRLRRGTMANLWRGLLSGVDRRADDLELVAERAMLLECSAADLDNHLRNTNDERACGETDDEVRAYLANRWTAYKLAGTPEGLRLQLARFKINRVTIVRELDLRHAAIAGAFGGETGYYFLVLDPPHPFLSGLAPIWDDGGTWQDGRVWGGIPESSLACLESLRRFVRRWEPSGESCRYILAGVDNTFAWDPVTFTYTGNAVSLPIAKGWEWTPAGFRAYYTTTYTTP